jgi:hypothetical protein
LTAYWNILVVHKNTVDSFHFRSQDIVVLQENRLSGVRATLLESGYPAGKIRFLTSGDITGKERTAEENLVWSAARYAMIPWLVVPNNVDTPYVIADFSGAGDRQPDLGDNFVRLYAGNYLVLFRRAGQ